MTSLERPGEDAQRRARDAAPEAAPTDDAAVRQGADAPADDAAPAGELLWQRMHPVTPAVRGWKVLAVAFVIMLQQVGSRDLDGPVASLGGMSTLLLVLVGVGVVGFAYSAIAWRFMRYAIGDDTVHLNSGVLFRQQRQLRLDRLQAVDVVQPALARILGLAELKLEAAGGSDSGVVLGLLREAEAQQLRNELLAMAAGVRSAQTPSEPSQAAPEHQVIEVSGGQLVVSILRTSATIVLVLVLVGLAVLAVATRQLGPVFGVLPALLGIGSYVWQRFSREFGFRAAISPDGIRLRHGLLESRAQTVPPGRVQAVRLQQGLLWRRADWWRVQMNVAGYGTDTEGSETVLLPVGSREEAMTALWLVLPDLGTDRPRELLDAALSGDGADEGFITSPRRARWIDPLTWRRTGFVVTDRALIVRRGRLLRRVDVIPHERMQSLGVRRGPVQRRLGLVTFAVHSTPGPVLPFVPHLDEADAGRLLAEQVLRAEQARATAGPERWMDTAAAGQGTDRPQHGTGQDGRADERP